MTVKGHVNNRTDESLSERQQPKHRTYHSWQLVFPNPADFMWKHDIVFPQHSIKLKSFSWNIWFISFVGGFHMKSTRFHVKSTGFCEIHQISCEICWILWNLPDFMNVSFWVITKYRSSFQKTNKRNIMWVFNRCIRCISEVEAFWNWSQAFCRAKHTREVLLWEMTPLYCWIELCWIGDNIWHLSFKDGPFPPSFSLTNSE